VRGRRFVYVMTQGFGAASQLEKDRHARFSPNVAINKFDRRGAADALRGRGKQYQRNSELVKAGRPTRCRLRHASPPASTTTGLPRLYQARRGLLQEGLKLDAAKLRRDGAAFDRAERPCAAAASAISGEIAETVRGYHACEDAERTRASGSSDGYQGCWKRAQGETPRSTD